MVSLSLFLKQTPERAELRGIASKLGPSRLEILTLKWSESDQEKLVEVSTRPTGVLRGTTSSEMEFEFQAAALSPNGAFVVVGGDTRGLSGTQSGRGVFESWNLDPLDDDSSLRPEPRQLPILDGRHVVKIAFTTIVCQVDIDVFTVGLTDAARLAAAGSVAVETGSSLPLLDWEFATACSAKATRGAGVSHGRTSLNVSNTHVIIARNLKRAVMPVDGGG